MKRLMFALLVCGTVLALYTSMTVRVTAAERVGSIMTYNYVKMNKSGGTSCKLN